VSEGYLAQNIWEKLLGYMFSVGSMTVPSGFHEQCDEVNKMLSNDTSGIINSLLDFTVSSASGTQYQIECTDKILQQILNQWLKEINLDLEGVPTGLQELSKEYFKERYISSMIVLRAKKWENITLEGNSILVPKTLWFANGSSIYVKRPDPKNYKLGTDKYFLDKLLKTEIPEGVTERLIIQKPFGRWGDDYPTPYMVRRGILRNWMMMNAIQDKSNEVINKILPYLFQIKRGSEAAFLQKGTKFEDTELQNMFDAFKTQVEKFKSAGGKTPANFTEWDTEYMHIIPDIRNMVSEELFKQSSRNIMAGFGFITVIQGVGSTRQQEVVNPKPFVAEVNNAVDGFKSLLSEMINLIILKNKEAHPKLFSDNKKLLIYNTPLKINVDGMLADLRSAFDRGVLSIESYQATLGFDVDIEREKRQKELKDGDEETFYPHLIQNREDIPDRMGIPAKPRNEKNENQNKKPGSPESQNFKNAELSEDLIIAPYTKENHPKYLDKYPQEAIDLWIKVFNEALPKGEEYAFPVAWTVMKKFLKRHYNKSDDKWIKKGQLNASVEEPDKEEETEKEIKTTKLENVKLKNKLMKKMIGDEGDK